MQENEITYEGTVERIYFRNEENGWTALRLSEVKPDDTIPDGVPEHGNGCAFSVAGYFIQIEEGQEIEITGVWNNHPQYGWQIKALRYVPKIPTTLTGIKRFLASSATFGIGPITAKALTDYYGEKTIEILDAKNPKLLECIPGIGKVKANAIVEGWNEGGILRDTMVMLAGYGVGELTAIKIIRHYGDQTLIKLQENPYILADEIDGIGFRKADAIAKGMGIENNDPRRLKGAVKYVLQQALQSGHCYLNGEQIQKEVEDYTGYEPSEIVGEMLLKSEIHGEEIEDGSFEYRGREIPRLRGIYYLPYVYETEKNVAWIIRKKMLDGHKFAGKLEIIEPSYLSLSTEQIKAYEMIFNSGICILTGGPGTGKTYTINEVVKTAEKMEKEVLLCAPTGRAAKRLEEVTGHEAKTIHRLLMYSPETHDFQINEENPLMGDILIVDEFSMVDIFLVHSLLKAVPDGMQIVLVGDKDQLPSVGPGNVLRDLLEV